MEGPFPEPRRAAAHPGTGGTGGELDLDVIDDMEDGDERISMTKGRSGA
jgi:hypothetical protein